MSATRLLSELQGLVAAINDVPVPLPVAPFHLAERDRCAALLGHDLAAGADEQVLLCEQDDEVRISVYIDDAVLDRLGRRDPGRRLDEDNFADYCTAMEGISHFQYLVWSIGCGRQVSLLELELQAEVDKYTVATWLLRRQGRNDLPQGLFRRLFDDVSFLAGLTEEQRRRYAEANRLAARFCRRIDAHLLARRFRPEKWLHALRQMYRFPHHHKLRFAACN